MIDNMKIWDAVCETDPKYTKPSDYGRKYTAIDPHSQVMAATKQFGPAGDGWGWSVQDVQYPPNDTVAVKVRVWHGVQDSYFEHWGQCGLFTNNDKTKDDQECLKKATTDGLTKCLSYLGFNADVFLGKFDDNKYVQYMKEKHEEVVPYVITKEEGYIISDICHLIRCCQSKEDMYSIMDEYSDDMGEFGDDVCHEDINQTSAEMLKIWEAGNQVQNIKYTFINVQHGLDSFKSMGKQMHGLTSLPLVETYYQRWCHKINALDTKQFNVEKHKENGLTPYKRLENLYNKKIKELS